MKCIKQEYAKLVSVTNTDGTAKRNIAASCIGAEGIAGVYMSDEKYPGKALIDFTPFFNRADGTCFFDCYFHTSFGEIEETDEILKITTKNSIYTFVKLNSNIELKLDEADRQSKESNVRLSRDEVFANARRSRVE